MLDSVTPPGVVMVLAPPPNVLAPAPIVTADSEISLPFMMSFAPVVIAAAPLNMTPENCVVAPSDAPPTGAQNTFSIDAPLVSVTVDPSAEVSAPFILKTYVPVALSVIPAVPILAAPSIQYTPGAYWPMCPCVVSVARLIAPFANVNVHASPAFVVPSHVPMLPSTTCSSPS